MKNLGKKSEININFHRSLQPEKHQTIDTINPIPRHQSRFKIGFSSHWCLWVGAIAQSGERRKFENIFIDDRRRRLTWML